MSHWLYKNKIIEEAPEGAFGFVYLITNKKSGKMYIGRKYFGKTRRVKKKGSKRRRVIRKDSDWRTYIGSSKVLQEQIQKRKSSNELIYKIESLFNRLSNKKIDNILNIPKL